MHKLISSQRRRGCQLKAFMLNFSYILSNRYRIRSLMRLGIFADIHGNLPALQAMRADMQSCGDFDMIWCLGDLAALGGQAVECIREVVALREEVGADKFKIIGGNTDRYLVTGARIGFPPPKDEGEYDAYRANILSMSAIYQWTMAQLGWADFAALREILGQETRLAVPDFGTVIGFHAIPGDDEAMSLRPDSPEEEAADALLDREGRLAVCGHTHLAMDRLVGKWRVLNPGSVGLSFGNKGVAEWAVLEWRDGECVADLRQVPYDVAATLRAWKALGHPELEWIRQRLVG